jgi:FlgN protein
VDPTAPDALIELLEHEEQLLTELLKLATGQQSAIVNADYSAMEHLSQQLDAASGRLQVLENEREAMVAGGFAAGATLGDVAARVGGRGGARLDHTRSQLARASGALKAQQEQNATLLLGAIRLRERWVGMLAGMTNATYGARGRQEFQQTRGIVSRSA